MATLYITEFVKIGTMLGGESILAGEMPPNAEQAIDIGASSTPSNPWQPGTKFVMICNDAPCCLAFGPSPEAQLDIHRVPADRERFYTVRPGDRLAVIAST